jgi:hypothetical protein
MPTRAGFVHLRDIGLDTVYRTTGHPREYCSVRTWQFRGSTVTLYQRC